MINKHYREVPSNTIAQTFLDFGTGFESFRRVAKASSEPNGLTELAALEPKSTCSLHYAGDMLQTLTNGLLRDNSVVGLEGAARRLARSKVSSDWIVTFLAQNSREFDLVAPIVVCCPGSNPKTVELPLPRGREPREIPLLEALKPSRLDYHINKDALTSIGVIGASHSAILLLRNLFNLSRGSHPHLTVKWFTRHKELKYAQYMDGWILHDNTGLKGVAADFGRQYLEGDRLAQSGAGDVITRVDCSGGPEKEKEAFLRDLTRCDSVVHAVGFEKLAFTPDDIDVEFDDTTGGFVDSATREPVPGLFGAGIAFPEKVTDRAGNVEHAVGLFKFMKFLKRVVPEWVKAGQKPVKV
ncbi:hypothetical protein PG999_000443 [Apiospora kogelbergensis]|uniref:Pyridine nucleotide-disulphide oxidoreductase n=1 Tax=Apiospora kogelbergensis TaxID=1337665 RepID=A0AAW0RBK0_9PEZI